MDTYYFQLDCGNQNAGNEYCPGPNDIVSHYTQIILDGQCCIPEPKPDGERLIDLSHSIDVRKAKTIDAVEIIKGHHIKGKKVIVAGIFQLGIQYSALEETQKVHYFECEIPFNAILLDCRHGMEHLFPPNFNLDNFLVHVCLESLQVERVDERCFNKTIVLMIWLQPVPNQG